MKRLFRGEPLELLSRELNVTAARLSDWRDCVESVANLTTNIERKLEAGYRRIGNRIAASSNSARALHMMTLTRKP